LIEDFGQLRAFIKRTARGAYEQAVALGRAECVELKVRVLIGGGDPA